MSFVPGSAAGKLIFASSELKRTIGRGAKMLGGATPFEEADTFGIAGVCRFELRAEAGELVFQLGAGPPDAIEWSPDLQAFVLRSAPQAPIEPLGFLRGELLTALSKASGG